ncbi:uncharacterized protein [Primulina eburnea]|uniref:uncharacterized protein n=1 Tax=Primulina eburnea TaxID=1245227 RepID=UPI003C6C3CB1
MAFPLHVLRHFGFSERVVAMVSACISHFHFSVNINGSLSGFFGSTTAYGREINCPLFILGAEYLSRGLHRLYLQYPIIRYRSGCDILISHLTYANDIIIFANCGSRGIQRLIDFCITMRIVLGCHERHRSRLLRITGFADGHLPPKYLGVPLFWGNMVCSLFDPLLQSVKRRRQVVQPPLAVIEKLERAFNAFFWGSRPLEKKWHWARWSRSCLLMVEWGLGFKILKDLVDSFSIKLWFRLRQGSSL